MSTKQEPPTEKPATSASTFLDAIVHRRSVYALNNKPSASDADVAAILKSVMLHVPSAFNSQSARAVLLLGDAHAQFWGPLVDDAVDAATTDDEAKRERAKGRLPGFRGARGTVLFFESRDAVAGLAEKAAAYRDLVPGWSGHASGMHQFAVWTAVEAAGMGANLQHYNYLPTLEGKVHEAFGLPKDWSLEAQLVFGGVNEGGWPKEGKDKVSTDETARVIGATW